MIDRVRKEFKAAFFDNAAGTVVFDKMSDGNGVEVQLVKAIADDGFYGFGHKSFAPEIFCKNITDFFYVRIRKVRYGHLVRIFNSYAADDLSAFLIDYGENVLAFDEHSEHFAALFN